MFRPLQTIFSEVICKGMHVLVFFRKWLPLRRTVLRLKHAEKKIKIANRYLWLHVQWDRIKYCIRETLLYKQSVCFECEVDIENWKLSSQFLIAATRRKCKWQINLSAHCHHALTYATFRTHLRVPLKSPLTFPSPVVTTLLCLLIVLHSISAK
jgi:hypothetical protein